MVSLLWYNQEEPKINECTKNEAEQLSKEAELFKLRQQSAAQFLFNTA
jgi:ribosomal protein L29